MTGARASDVAALVAEETQAEEERRTSFLELFFDLVFVFAITQVTALILEDTSAAGFLRSALVLALAWWAWSAYAWLTNAIDIGSVVARVLVLAGMGGAFVMALAVPDAYQDEGPWFAVAYFGVRIVAVALYLWGVRADRGQFLAVLRLSPWFVTAAVVALAGGFAESDTRAAVWLLSLTIDVVGTLTVARAGFRVSPSHFAERYGLIVIIALGESIVAIGIGTADLERDERFALAVAVAFVGVAVLWWAYFGWTSVAAERALKRTSPELRGPLARDVFTFLHYPVVLGIIFFAVAAKKTLEHPSDPLSEAGRWALGIGVASFLLAFALMRYRVVRRVAWERIGGAAAALALAVALDSTDALLTLTIVIAVVAVALAVESARLREVRASLRVE